MYILEVMIGIIVGFFVMGLIIGILLDLVSIYLSIYYCVLGYEKIWVIIIGGWSMKCVKFYRDLKFGEIDWVRV